MTMTAAPVAEPVTRTLSTAPCCPQCGTDLEGTQPFEEMQAAVLDAHNKIQELQNQVRLLNEKASSAVDRWADYEDEIARLRGQLKQQQSQSQAFPAASQISSPQQQSQQQHAAAALATPPQSATPSTTATANASPASVAPRSVGSVSSFLPTGAASRLSAFLTSRKSTPNLKSGTPPAGSHPHMPTYQSTLSQSFTQSSPLQQPFQSTPSVQHQKEISDLQTALDTEKSLHTETRSKLAKAEAKLTATSREIEELSVTLFSEANEMVANERRARAKLEERVKTLEKRDEQKKERLEMLEGAVRRMERVREVLRETEMLESGRGVGREDMDGEGEGDSDYEDGGKLVAVVTPRGDKPRLDLDD
ncbi:hypothetical protein QBC32DRAFT_213249 [Pseudoneurospora amorphoporcata]|uniref:GDP/GTP exchange factor Sec2 N-terminal domain-containing protein n=1 Tax=Pseudoneurospora amorphoporcata TaxID=241081 RepID=A0AAN6NW24_9PEZI|nr:hypothetical protein QBC32DRAFT_213249 [Pseudoneurospora amorphoporcata]